MEFNINHPIIFVIVGIIIAVVLAQSVYFLVKSIRRARNIGMDMKIIKKTVKSSAIFTVAPAVSIVIAVISLSQSLGIPLPWLRLSVVGSLSYEAIAATNAASGMGKTLSDFVGNMDAMSYITITFVMTLSIMVGIWLVPVLGKRIQNGLINFEKKDAKWSNLLQNGLFIGMISAFVGYVFCDVSRLWSSIDGVYTNKNGEMFSSTSGLVPVLVMLVSSLVMASCGILLKRLNWKWLNDYALPISMVLGMVAAIPLTNWLGGALI